MKALLTRLVKPATEIIFGSEDIKQAQWKQLANFLSIFGAAIFGLIVVPAYKQGYNFIAILWILLSLAFQWLAIRLLSNIRDEE